MEPENTTNAAPQQTQENPKNNKSLEKLLVVLIIFVTLVPMIVIMRFAFSGIAKREQNGGADAKISQETTETAPSEETSNTEQSTMSEVDNEQQKLRDALDTYASRVAEYQSNNNNKTPFADSKPGYVFNKNNMFITRYIGTEKYTDITLRYLGSTDELKGNFLVGASIFAPRSADEADNTIYAITKAECMTGNGQYAPIDSEAGVAMFILLGNGEIDCRNN